MLDTLIQNRYRLEAELGRGGMGTVYRAHDTLLERDVAIKVLSNSGLGTEGRARLLREAQAVARLNHPNIVTVHDAGEVDGTPFIVMELVAGGTLRHMPTPTLTDALVYARQICAALAHAHGQGIIHRDLKPENVVITPTGTAKLMDFGLAWSENAPRLTEEGTLLGTFAYLAPELIMGGAASPQSDLYAFGVMLYELLAGRPPFEGSDLMLLLGQHLHAPVTPPRTHNPDIPPDLDALVVRLLSKAAEDRPASAAEVLAALGVPEPSESVTLARPMSAPKHNLPAQLSTFIGREKEIAQVKQKLTEYRLVTLTGSGGCGKTRLAIQVATDFANANRYKHGVWWVDLAALSDPALVPQKVAQVFDLRELADAPLITVLTNYFRAKELLLVPDNCEHLIAACARLAETLLSACPRLQILATSREALGLTGEVAWYVPSLESPDPHNMPPPENLAQYDAIRLFTERAHAVAPYWQLADHAEAAARICCRLDGIPLAIELAAARLKVLAAEQIAERLDDRFQLLTGGSRTALPHHRTLRATIDWSYGLLADEERILFQRLAIFAGGCTLAAVESVCSGNGMAQDDVLDVLTRLVDKSMVVVDNVQDGRRHRMLETIRQYAHEKLVESGELQAVRDRHLDYFLRLAEEGEPHVKIGQTVWLDRLETEFDNVRAAWEQAIESDAELALRLASALEWFWVIRGNPKEGWTWLTRLLPRTEAWGTSKRRARVLRLAGSLANHWGDTKSAHPLVEASLAIAKAICDKHEVALTLHTLGRVFLSLGNWSEARTCYQDSQALYREVGDAWSSGYTTMGLGQLAFGAGDYESARTLFVQSLSLFRNLGDKRGLLATLNGQGELARLQDDYVRAAAFYTESLQLARELMDRRRQVVMLENLGYVALHERDYVRARALFEEGLALNRQCERASGLSGYVAGFAGIIGANGNSLQAAQLLGAVEASYQALGTVMAPADRKEYDQILAAVRVQLDEATFNAAWAEGRKMTLEQAIEYALKT